jgi:hypothetical protein
VLCFHVQRAKDRRRNRLNSFKKTAFTIFPDRRSHEHRVLDRVADPQHRNTIVGATSHRSRPFYAVRD